MAERMHKWMKGAVRPGHKGALTAKATAAGESPMQFARQHAHAPGLTGRQARFALIAQKQSIPPKGSDNNRAERRYSKMR